MLLRGPVVSMVTILSLELPCRKLGLMAKGFYSRHHGDHSVLCHHSDCRPGLADITTCLVPRSVPVTLTKERRPLCPRTRQRRRLGFSGLPAWPCVLGTARSFLLLSFPVLKPELDGGPEPHKPSWVYTAKTEAHVTVWVCSPGSPSPGYNCTTDVHHHSPDVPSEAGLCSGKI